MGHPIISREAKDEIFGEKSHEKISEELKSTKEHQTRVIY
jgi:hypothetical protein